MADASRLRLLERALRAAEDMDRLTEIEVRSMRGSRVTDRARKIRLMRRAAAIEDLTETRKAHAEALAEHRAAIRREDAIRQEEIRQHLVAVAERQARILETAGKLAIFHGTKIEDWLETDGELVVSPRDIAEITGLDLRVARENVMKWKAEPTFIGDWGVPTRESQMAAAFNGAERARRGVGVLPYLDFDQIWDEDWG